jgi:mannosyl-oligosaccharide alpha-1,2-mannosidase
VAAPQGAYYILRPEVAESLFILHELTRDPIYREWGAQIFDAIERNCRTAYGYASLADVRHPGPGRLNDKMESFFMAETLKYLYLLQKPNHGISLDEFVFNTEAHPLRFAE